MNSILNEETLKLLSSIVGMIGGFLGFFVFIDNYILKFKPRLNISNRLFFRYRTEEKNPMTQGRSLESVILKIEAINERNKIGRIDDFAIRIYDSRATLPSGYMLYSENVLEHLPSKSSFFEKDEPSSFSPISILGRSTKNIVVEFKPRKYMNVTLNPEGSLKLDFLYYLPKKGWKTVGSFMPYYFKGHNEQEDPNGVIEYCLLDNSVTREAASDSLKLPKVGIYNGISGKYISFYLMRPVWAIKNITTYPLKVFKLIGALIEALFRQITSYCLILPLINVKSRTLPRVQIRPARAHLIDDTDTALKKCKDNIEKIAHKINSKADSKAQITIRDESTSFKIQRGRLEVKFYKSGDGHLRANDTGGYPQMFTFSMELVEFPFGFRLWKVNNKIMTIKSACIYVMDSFILLAH